MIWKPIKNFEKLYEVSNKGHIRSFDKLVSHWRGGTSLRKGRLLSLRTDKDGYKDVCLQDNKQRTYLRVHRIVAMTFIENPDNLPLVNHKDGIKDNNKVDNLEWATLSDNSQHAYDSGLNFGGGEGEMHYATTLTNKQVIKIRKELKKGIRNKDLAKLYNVSHNTIYRIKYRLSSIPKEVLLDEDIEQIVFYFDLDGYQRHCKQHKEYWEWVEKRNPERYKDNMKGNVGYDHKNMMHCVRLVEVAEDIAKQGTIVVRRPNRDYLLSIRMGEHKYEDLLSYVEGKVETLDELFNNSNLPNEVNTEKTRSLLQTIRLEN